jgi:hypothetical protein
MPVLNAQQINGVVRTSEPVWSNIERLSEASSAWFTYNTHEGVYAWTINQAGNSVAAISEADIIGPIQISGSGLTNLYNSVEVEYPRNDMNDQPHYATLNLPDGLRNAYEPDNTLQMSSEFINNQPQAEYVGMVTLKQSRLDLTVTIVMDYTKINLEAGDIIDITSSTYGWTAKEFRIMRVRELEGDDGSLRLEFSCTEYDDSIYSGTWDNFLVAGASNVRSIGSIGTPGTPTVALTTKNSLPAQTVTTTVPSGVVDRVQFWAGNVSITSNVANTDFNLVGSVASTNANAFTQSGNVVFNSTSLTNGTWAWKSRGVNADGVGPYSNVSANVAYVRTQVTDAIGNNTSLLDSAGTPIAALLALPLLLKGLDTYMNGNSNLATAVGSQISSSSSTNLLSFQKELSIGTSTGNVLSPWRGGNSTYTTTNSLAFTIPSASNISIDMSANFGSTTYTTATGLRRIDFALFTGDTYGAGNIVENFNGDPTRAWEGGTSLSNMEAFGDLYTREIGNINAGTYHIESSYWSNVGDAVTINIAINSVNNFYNS